MGIIQYICEQEYRDDLVGELGRWMCDKNNRYPDDYNLAFELASKEFAACGNWTRQAAVQFLNANKNLQKIIKIEPRISKIITVALKERAYSGYNKSDMYKKYKEKAYKLVGYCAEKEEINDSDSYEIVIQTIDRLLPPDSLILYPDGMPDDINLDL